MKVLVVHPSLNFFGGAEKVCLDLVNTLIEEGIKVDVLTIDKIKNKKIIKNIFLKNIFLKENFSLFYFFELPKVISRIQHRYNLTITTYGEFEGLWCCDVIYFNSIPFSLSKYFPGTEPYLLKNKVIRNIYNEFLKMTINFNLDNKILIVNSKFTKYVIKNFYRVDANVVYPAAIRENTFNHSIEKKKDFILIISRFTPGKNIEFVLELLKFLDIEIKIVGRISSRKYFLKIYNKCKKYIKNEKLKIYPNTSNKILKKLLNSANYYLHCNPNESFGISIIEAMYHKCLTILPRFGASWFDFAKNDDILLKLTYRSSLDISKIIKNFDNLDENKLNIIRNHLYKKSLKFNLNNFKKNIINIIFSSV